MNGTLGADTINCSGIVTGTTFVGNGDFVDIDVDGHTNLDNVSVAGVCTATAFVSSAGQLSNRNKIQNGAMNVSQRFDGDAHTPSSTSRIYTLDRWAYWSNQASKTTIQQVEDAPVGFKYSSKCTVASAYSISSGDWFGYMTHIEGQLSLIHI